MKNYLFACVSLLAVVGASSTATAKPKVPDARVIESYNPSEYGLSGDAGGQAGALPQASFSQADLGRLGVISESYQVTLGIIEDILADIRSRSPAPDLDPQVQFYNSLLPDARAIGRDLIVVSTGLLAALQEEPDSIRAHALAFILAHEYGHLLYDHPETYKKSLESTKVSKPIGEGYIALKQVQGVHASLGGAGSAANKTFYDAEKGFMAASAASPWIEAELYRAVYAPYRKDAEQLADYMASDLLLEPETTETNFDAATGAQPLRGLYAVYDEEERTALKEAAKDLNETSARATKDMATVAPGLMMAGGGEQLGDIFVQRMKLAGAEFVGRTLLRRLDVSKVHLYYSSDDRVDAIDDYVEQFYPVREQFVDDDRLSKLGVALGEAFAKEHTASAAADQAMKLLTRNDIAGARKALEEVSGKEAFKNMGYLLASADVEFADGDLQTALKHYKSAVDRNDAPPRAFIGLSKTHLRLGEGDEAIAALRKGAERYSMREFIVRIIDANVSLGRNEDALNALAECQGLGDKGLAKACNEAAKPAQPKKERRNPFGIDLGDVGDVIDSVTD